MNTERTFLAVALALLLAACSTSSPTGMAEDQRLGQASRATLAAQIIDPDPQYEYLDPATSGEHAAQAIDRYRKDKVKKPDKVTSTSTQGGSGPSGN